MIKSQINGVLSPFLQELRFKEAIKFIKGKKILDVGCSLGELTKYLPKNIEYYGIERDKEYYENAEKINPKYKFINLYLNERSVNYLKIPKMDSIVLLAVLEHFDKPLEILRGLNKYLIKDGRIIITTPSYIIKNIHKIGGKIGLFSSEAYEHKQYFSKKKLFDICRKAGYEIEYYKRFEFGFNHLIVLRK